MSHSLELSGYRAYLTAIGTQAGATVILTATAVALVRAGDFPEAG